MEARPPASLPTKDFGFGRSVRAYRISAVCLCDCKQGTTKEWLPGGENQRGGRVTVSGYRKVLLLLAQGKADGRRPT